MTVAAKIPEAAQATATSAMPNTEQALNWRHCWYPVTFVQDLPKNRPYGFSVYDEPFVLLRNQDGKLNHWNTNKVLEQDLSIVVGQQAQIERLEHSLKDLYLPLKTSDVFVMEYRKWLDKVGQSLPFYQGYSTSKRASDNDECDRLSALADRFSRHTQICSSCNRAYQVTNRLKQVSVGVAITLAALAIVTDYSWYQVVAMSLALLAVALAVVAQIVKTKFERSYKRH